MTSNYGQELLARGLVREASLYVYTSFPPKCALFNWQETVSQMIRSLWLSNVVISFPSIKLSSYQSSALMRACVCVCMCVFASYTLWNVFGLYLPPASVYTCVFLCAWLPSVFAISLSCPGESSVSGRVSKAAKAESQRKQQFHCLVLATENYRCLDSQHAQQGTTFLFRGAGNVVIVMASFFENTYSWTLLSSFRLWGGRGRRRMRERTCKRMRLWHSLSKWKLRHVSH